MIMKLHTLAPHVPLIIDIEVKGQGCGALVTEFLCCFEYSFGSDLLASRHLCPGS